jgi:hypothetical protein
MTGADNVAHLRQIWRDLAEQAAIDGDWTESDAASAAYDKARHDHENPTPTAAEVARLRATWLATYDRYDRDDAYHAYMTAQFALHESPE